MAVKVFRKKQQEEGTLAEGTLSGRGVAKDIIEGMRRLTSSLNKFELSSLEDPRFIDTVGCLQEAWSSLQTTASSTLGNLENMEGECPKRRRISERR